MSIAKMRSNFRWLVEGNPQVILFDIGSAAYKMNEFKQVKLVINMEQSFLKTLVNN